MSTFDVVSHGEKFTFDSSKWDTEFQAYLTYQALKVLLDRSSASLTKKGGATDEKRLEACRNVAARLRRGELPARGGAGNNHMTDEDHCLRQWLNIELKADKGESVADQLSRFTKIRARNDGVDYHESMDETMKEAIENEELYKLFLAARKGVKTSSPASSLNVTLRNPNQ